MPFDTNGSQPPTAGAVPCARRAGRHKTLGHRGGRKSPEARKLMSKGLEGEGLPMGQDRSVLGSKRITAAVTETH